MKIKMKIDKEKNNEFPSEWDVLNVEDIAEVNPRIDKSLINDNLIVSFVPMPAVAAENGFIDVTQERPFFEVKKGYTGFLEGDVLFAKITPCMENGKMAVVPKLINGYGFGSTEFHVLRPKTVNAKYLYFFVSSENFRRNAEHYMTGAVGQKRVPVSYLTKCKIPIAPLNEQKRIVAEIEKQFSRLDEAVENLNRVKANLKRYKAAILKAAVEGRLTEEWRKAHPEVEPAIKLLDRILAERRKKWEDAELDKMGAKGIVPQDDKWKKKYKSPVTLDTEGLPLLPKSWIWTSLDQIGQENRPILYGIIKPGPHIADGVPYVRVMEMKDGHIDVSILKRASQERAAKFARATLKEGDILISKDGTIGRVAIVPPELEGGNITQHVMRAPTHKYVSNLYIAWAIRSTICQRWLTGETKGVALRGVNVEDFRRLPIPLPPSKEQYIIVSEIIRIMSIVDILDVEVDKNILRANRLRQSILKKAFSGKLVPHDEMDEPTPGLSSN